MVPIIVDYTGVEKTHSPGITTPPKPDTTFLFLFMRIEIAIILNCIKYKVTIRLSINIVEALRHYNIKQLESELTSLRNFFLSKESNYKTYKTWHNN